MGWSSNRSGLSKMFYCTCFSNVNLSYIADGEVLQTVRMEMELVKKLCYGQDKFHTKPIKREDPMGTEIGLTRSYVHILKIIITFKEFNSQPQF